MKRGQTHAAPQDKSAWTITSKVALRCYCLEHLSQICY